MVYCSITGEEMYEGWYNENSGEHFKYEKDYLIHIEKILIEEKEFLENFVEWETPKTKDDKIEFAYNHFGCYWSQWTEDFEE